MEIERYYTVSETAELLKVHIETIRRAIRAGHLKAYRMPGGRRYRITTKAIQEFLEDEKPQ